MEWSADAVESVVEQDVKWVRRFVPNRRSSRVSVVLGNGAVFAPGSRFFLFRYGGWPCVVEGMDEWVAAFKGVVPVGTEFFGCFAEDEGDEALGRRRAGRCVLVLVDFGRVERRGKVQVNGSGLSVFGVEPLVGGFGSTGVWRSLDEVERSVDAGMVLWQRNVEQWCGARGCFGQRLMEQVGTS